MTSPAKRSLARVSWSYDVLEPLPATVQAQARALIEASGARVYESRVYTYGVSYVARHSPKEQRLYTALKAIMPAPFL